MRISDWSSDVCSSDLPSRSKLPARIASGCSAARTGDLVLIEIRRSALKLRRVAIVCPVRTAVGKFGGGLSALTAGDRKSVGSGKSVSVRVDLGSRRILKKKQHKTRLRDTIKIPTPPNNK